MLKRIVLWSIAVWLLLFAIPQTRKVALFIIPTGTRPDDIIAWLVLISLLSIVSWRVFLRPMIVAKKQRQLNKERMVTLQTRIDVLINLLYGWVINSPSQLYIAYPTPHTLSSTEQLISLLDLESRHFERVKTSSKLKDLPELERIYSALAGSEDEFIWEEVTELLVSTDPAGGYIDQVGAGYTPELPLLLTGPDHLGAVYYVLDPKNKPVQ